MLATLRLKGFGNTGQRNGVINPNISLLRYVFLEGRGGEFEIRLDQV